jgi:hypothetical protein
MTFEEIVKKHFRPGSLFDEQPVKAQLLEDLEQNRKINSRLYFVYLALVVVVAVAAIGALLDGMFSGKSAMLGLLAGAGVTVPGMLHLTKSAVREWSRSDLLIAIAKSSDEQHLQKILETLLSSKMLGF